MVRFTGMLTAFSKATFSEGGLLLSIAKLAKILCFLLSFSA
jgi:hypothetical protein